jgi:hypothetical protein
MFVQKLEFVGKFYRGNRWSRAALLGRQELPKKYRGSSHHDLPSSNEGEVAQELQQLTAEAETDRHIRQGNSDGLEAFQDPGLIVADAAILLCPDGDEALEGFVSAIVQCNDGWREQYGCWNHDATVRCSLLGNDKAVQHCVDEGVGLAGRDGNDRFVAGFEAQRIGFWQILLRDQVLGGAQVDRERAFRVVEFGPGLVLHLVLGRDQNEAVVVCRIREGDRHGAHWRRGHGKGHVHLAALYVENGVPPDRFDHFQFNVEGLGDVVCHVDRKALPFAGARILAEIGDFVEDGGDAQNTSAADVVDRASRGRRRAKQG